MSDPNQWSNNPQSPYPPFQNTNTQIQTPINNQQSSGQVSYSQTSHSHSAYSVSVRPLVRGGSTYYTVPNQAQQTQPLPSHLAALMPPNQLPAMTPQPSYYTPASSNPLNASAMGNYYNASNTQGGSYPNLYLQSMGTSDAQGYQSPSYQTPTQGVFEVDPAIFNDQVDPNLSPQTLASSAPLPPPSTAPAPPTSSDTRPNPRESEELIKLRKEAEEAKLEAEKVNETLRLERKAHADQKQAEAEASLQTQRQQLAQREEELKAEKAAFQKEKEASLQSKPNPVSAKPPNPTQPTAPAPPQPMEQQPAETGETPPVMEDENMEASTSAQPQPPPPVPQPTNPNPQPQNPAPPLKPPPYSTHRGQLPQSSPGAPPYRSRQNSTSIPSLLTLNPGPNPTAQNPVSNQGPSERGLDGDFTIHEVPAQGEVQGKHCPPWVNETTMGDAVYCSLNPYLPWWMWKHNFIPHPATSKIAKRQISAQIHCPTFIPHLKYTHYYWDHEAYRGMGRIVPVKDISMIPRGRQQYYPITAITLDYILGKQEAKQGSPPHLQLLQDQGTKVYRYIRKPLRFQLMDNPNQAITIDGQRFSPLGHLAYWYRGHRWDDRPAMAKVVAKTSCQATEYDRDYDADCKIPRVSFHWEVNQFSSAPGLVQAFNIVFDETKRAFGPVSPPLTPSTYTPIDTPSVYHLPIKTLPHDNNQPSSSGSQQQPTTSRAHRSQSRGRQGQSRDPSRDTRSFPQKVPSNKRRQSQSRQQFNRSIDSSEQPAKVSRDCSTQELSELRREVGQLSRHILINKEIQRAENLTSRILTQRRPDNLMAALHKPDFPLEMQAEFDHALAQTTQAIKESEIEYVLPLPDNVPRQDVIQISGITKHKYLDWHARSLTGNLRAAKDAVPWILLRSATYSGRSSGAEIATDPVSLNSQMNQFLANQTKSNLFLTSLSIKFLPFLRPDAGMSGREALQLQKWVASLLNQFGPEDPSSGPAIDFKAIPVVFTLESITGDSLHVYLSHFTKPPPHLLINGSAAVDPLSFQTFSRWVEGLTAYVGHHSSPELAQQVQARASEILPLLNSISARSHLSPPYATSPSFPLWLVAYLYVHPTILLHDTHRILECMRFTYGETCNWYGTDNDSTPMFSKEWKALLGRHIDTMEFPRRNDEICSDASLWDRTCPRPQGEHAYFDLAIIHGDAMGDLTFSADWSKPIEEKIIGPRTAFTFALLKFTEFTETEVQDLLKLATHSAEQLFHIHLHYFLHFSYDAANNGHFTFISSHFHTLLANHHRYSQPQGTIPYQGKDRALETLINMLGQRDGQPNILANIELQCRQVVDDIIRPQADLLSQVARGTIEYIEDPNRDPESTNNRPHLKPFLMGLREKVGHGLDHMTDLFSMCIRPASRQWLYRQVIHSKVLRILGYQVRLRLLCAIALRYDSNWAVPSQRRLKITTPESSSRLTTIEHDDLIRDNELRVLCRRVGELEDTQSLLLHGMSILTKENNSISRVLQLLIQTGHIPIQPDNQTYPGIRVLAQPSPLSAEANFNNLSKAATEKVESVLTADREILLQLQRTLANRQDRQEEGVAHLRMSWEELQTLRLQSFQPSVDTSNPNSNLDNVPGGRETWDFLQPTLDRYGSIANSPVSIRNHIKELLDAQDFQRAQQWLDPNKTPPFTALPETLKLLLQKGDITEHQYHNQMGLLQQLKLGKVWKTDLSELSSRLQASDKVLPILSDTARDLVSRSNIAALYRNDADYINQYNNFSYQTSSQIHQETQQIAAADKARDDDLVFIREQMAGCSVSTTRRTLPKKSPHWALGQVKTEPVDSGYQYATNAASDLTIRVEPVTDSPPPPNQNLDLNDGNYSPTGAVQDLEDLLPPGNNTLPVEDGMEQGVTNP